MATKKQKQHGKQKATKTAAPAGPVKAPRKSATGEAEARIGEAQARIAAMGARSIGKLVSWNADRVDVPRADARALFASIGLTDLVPDLAPATALSRAVNEGQKPAGFVARPFASAKGAAVAYGLYQQIAGDGERGDRFVLGARVRIDLGASGALVALPPEDDAPISEAMAWAEQIAARGNHLVTHATSRDISAALVEMAAALAALPLRDRGGFYLIPPGRAERWDTLRPGLRDLGFRPISIDMHDAPENVATAGEAAQGALETEVAELLTDLERATVHDLRADAIERRVSLCDELAVKADLYRGVLEGAAAQIEARVAEMRASFVRALDEAQAAAKEGRPLHSPERAQRLSEAARKAHATRRAMAAAQPAEAPTA